MSNRCQCEGLVLPLEPGQPTRNTTDYRLQLWVYQVCRSLLPHLKQLSLLPSVFKTYYQRSNDTESWIYNVDYHFVIVLAYGALVPGINPWPAQRSNKAALGITPDKHSPGGLTDISNYMYPIRSSFMSVVRVVSNGSLRLRPGHQILSCPSMSGRTEPCFIPRFHYNILICSHEKTEQWYWCQTLLSWDLETT